MKRLTEAVFVLLILLLVNQAYAFDKYYVRTDGGTASECWGQADLSKANAIVETRNNVTKKNCALNHPFWLVAPQGPNNVGLLKGGDTLEIDGSNGAQYMMGWGAPNIVDTSKCHGTYPWDCYMKSIPSGPDADHKTRILGKGWDTGCSTPPQLWGTERAKTVLNFQGSNHVEVQCLEVTDHSGCQEMGKSACNRDTAPYGPWAQYGLIAADSQDVFIKNVNIHGMANRGAYIGRVKDWFLEDSKLIANPWAGWEGDIGAGNSSNSGTISFTRVAIKYSGCGETYPGKIPYNCFSQDQGGYGDGLGTEKTGGNWIFDGVDISHNVSDGADLLYHDGNGKITIKGGSKFLGNGGNQVKVNANTDIDYTDIDGECAWFSRNTSLVWNASTFNNCRAQGNALSLSFRAGTIVNIGRNVNFKNIEGTAAILSGGNTCNGTEKLNLDQGATFDLKDRYFEPGRKADKYYASGDINGNGDGPCGFKSSTGVKLTVVGPAPQPIPQPTPQPEPTPQPQPIPTPSPFQWCGALLPTQAGQKTEGKDNNGNYCAKVGIPITQACLPCPSCQEQEVCPTCIDCTEPKANSFESMTSFKSKLSGYLNEAKGFGELIKGVYTGSKKDYYRIEIEKVQP